MCGWVQWSIEMKVERNYNLAPQKDRINKTKLLKIIVIYSTRVCLTVFFPYLM